MITNSYQNLKAVAVQILDEDFGIENADELNNWQLKEIIKLLSILVDGEDSKKAEKEKEDFYEKNPHGI